MKTQTQLNISELDKLTEIETSNQIDTSKLQCFGFLLSQPDTFDIKTSPYPCQNCEWLKECV